MKLILYNNYSESNKVDKTIVKIIELDGILREASSLINPSILIELNPSNIKDRVTKDNQVLVKVNNLYVTWDNFMYNYVLSANYAYIPDFNRYYFINDIISVRNNMWRINMYVDVLMSYKKQIKKLNAFVNRNEFQYDKYVKDDLISYYYDKEIIEITPEKGDKVNTTFRSDIPQGVYTNVVLTAINDSPGEVQYNVNPPSDGLPMVGNGTTGQSLTYEAYATYPSRMINLAKRLLADDTLYNFILSVIFFPFSIGHDGTLVNVKLGSTTLDGATYVNGYHIKPSTSDYYVIADFTLEAEDFRDYEPFTQYQIWLPYLAWVNVNADDLMNNRIIVYYVVDFQSGSAQVTIYDVTNSRTIFTSNCQLGVKIGLSSTNAKEVEDNKNANNIGLGVGLLTSALAIAGGAVSGNAVAVGGGILTGGRTIANYIQNQNTNYYRAYGSVSSANSGLYLPQDVKIRKTRLKPKNYDENYAKLYGKPLNKYMDLSSLTGFTILGEVHIEDIGSITSTEFTELYNILTTGFIL